MHSHSPEIHYQQGLRLYQQDQHAPAEAELRLALADNPNSAPARAILALCLVEQAKLEAAANEAGRAIQLDRHHAVAHYAQARVFTNQQQYAEAEAAIREAIRLDPTAAAFYAQLATILLDRDDPEAALEAADQGLAHEPLDEGCESLRTLALLRLGRTEETGEVLDRAPDDALVDAGWAMLIAGKTTEALVHFRDAVRYSPYNFQARQGLIEALKVRYWFFRLLFALTSWGQRPGARIAWVLAVGALVLVVQLFPFANAIYVLAGVVLFPFVANLLLVILLRLNRFGRWLPTPKEYRQWACVGGLLAVVLGGTLVYEFGDDFAGALGLSAALHGLFLLAPVVSLFRLPRGWRWRIMLLFTIGIVVGWGVMVYCVIDGELEYQAGNIAAGNAAYQVAREALEVTICAALVAALLVQIFLTSRRG